MSRPSGQVLAATLLFVLAFAVLFGGLHRAGTAYAMKARAVRGNDLTALSCGAVYANGLSLVRLSNAVLMASAALDLARMAAAYAAAGGPASGPAAVAAALAADPRYRERVQDAQAATFGIGEDPESPPPGVYPCLIAAETLALAGDNRLEVQPPLKPLLLFNPETSRTDRVLLPHMALRFRTADELLMTEGDPGIEPCYRLREREGTWHRFGPDEVEPAPGAHPGQMRVRCDLPSPHRCRYVESCGGEDSAPGVGWVSDRLRGVLKGIRLDVTHRDDPPCHTVLVWGRLREKPARGRNIDQFSETVVAGQGLSAWHLAEKGFSARLKGLEPERFPLPRNLR